MKRIYALTAALIGAAGVVHAADPAKPVESRITAVTLYADRAEVTRTAAVSLPPGASQVAFAGLPGWIDEGSVRLTLAPERLGRIADVQIRREFLSTAADAALREATRSVQELQDRVAGLDDELKILEEQAQQVADAKVFAMDKLPRDAAIAALDIDQYGKTVDFVGQRLKELAARRRAIMAERREIDPELNVRQRQLCDVQQRQQLEQRTVIVALEAAAAGQGNLTLSYMLPGATWEPVHELRADAGSTGHVSLASHAVVSQTTGEDWPPAVLAFSTQSPTEIVRIPELQALLLDKPAPAVNIAAASATFEKARHLYAGQNAIWFRANNGDVSQVVYEDNGRRQRDVQSRVLASFEELKQRGTSYLFKGGVQVAIRGDGSAVRVPIGQVRLQASPLIVAAPEVSLNAAHVLQCVNSGSQPLLPGKVTLYRDGAFLGLTDVPFVAENESFDVMLGLADHIKLSRVLDRKRSSLRRGSRTRMEVAFDVTVENLSEKPAAVRLFDRIPVSEDREVRVFDVSIEPGVKPDSKGMLRWNLNLKPRSRQSFRIAYSVEYPPQAIAAARAKTSSGSEPAAPSDSVYLQLESLEKRF